MKCENPQNNQDDIHKSSLGCRQTAACGRLPYKGIGGISNSVRVFSAPGGPVRRTAVSRGVLRVLVSVWLALLIAGSLQPARPSIVIGVHREIHWVAFAGAAFLLFSLSRSRRQEILRAGSIFFLGLSLEVVQHLANRNRMEWRDIADNALAILVALALYRLSGAWKPAPDPSPR